MRAFLLAFIALVPLVGCGVQEPSDEIPTQTVRLFFFSETDLANATFDQPVSVRRVFPESDDTLDTTLQLLFAGPTSAEAEDGAHAFDDLTRLGSVYLGVSLDDGIAIVNFEPTAMGILNSAAARQYMAKEPIRSTLLQFSSVNDVQFAIDGEVVEQWDA